MKPPWLLIYSLAASHVDAAAVCATMTEDSHAWGGVHSAHWNADQAAPSSVTVNGNTYQSQTKASDGVGQAGFGNIDQYSYQAAQKWIYSFKLLKAAEEDSMADAGYSGLYVKLIFPVPIVATAIYGGCAYCTLRAASHVRFLLPPLAHAHAHAHAALLVLALLLRTDGAVDVTEKTPQYAYRGSRELVLRLCSGGNNYNGVCPRYIVTEGAQAVKLGKIEVRGEDTAMPHTHIVYTNTTEHTQCTIAPHADECTRCPGLIAALVHSLIAALV